MRCFIQLMSAAIILGSSAVAFPNGNGNGNGNGDGDGNRNGRSRCLTAADAFYLVNAHNLLFNSTYNPTLAADTHADNFVVYSGGDNFLDGTPDGSPVSSSLAAFGERRMRFPPGPTQVLSIDFSCTAITWRWLTTIGNIPIRGINLAYVVQAGGSANGWKLSVQWTELNIGNAVLAQGGTCGGRTA